MFGFKRNCCFFFVWSTVLWQSIFSYSWVVDDNFNLRSVHFCGGEHVSLEEPGDSIRDLFIPLLKVTNTLWKGHLTIRKRGHPIAELPGFKKTYSNKNTSDQDNHKMPHVARWRQLKYVLIFTPILGVSWSNLTIITFFKGVENSTHQLGLGFFRAWCTVGRLVPRSTS